MFELPSIIKRGPTKIQIIDEQIRQLENESKIAEKDMFAAMAQGQERG